MAELTRSEQIGELFGALAKAKLKYKELVRSHENTYTGSKYADLQDLMNATQDALSENGLAIVQFPVEYLDQKAAGAYSILGHSSGQYMAKETLLPATGRGKDGVERFNAQTIGAAQTYAMRYTYRGLAGIVGDEEDDGDSITDKTENTVSPPKPKTVKAPPVNSAPAQIGGDRPRNTLPVAQNRSETQHIQPSEVKGPPKAAIPAEAFDLSGDPNVIESTTSEAHKSGQTGGLAAKPDKTQFDAYVARVRDEIKPALEKAGLKPSKGQQTGAKLKSYILSNFGGGAKDLTDLSVLQWESFFADVETTLKFEDIVAKIEGGKSE
jgi:hypothetical protein